jgi:hypothetical protein
MRHWFSVRAFGAFFALAVLASSAVTAFADPRDFVLVNHTGAVITEVYVSASNLSDWGDDVMDEDVLGVNDTVTITFRRFTAGDCLYDIKVVLKDGREGELDQVDLCSTDTVTFNS